ncbi:MAG: DUF255 domain-containing protein [Rhizobiaceae bacterium]
MASKLIAASFVGVFIATTQLTISAIAFEGKGTENPRIEKSSSPYLRSHSRDLVRWYPWNEETFAAAKKADKPLMVSFGYMACHWCHVMQEEHFNDPSMARAINENFIPVMVDREQHPTLDESYMLVTEALTKRGGWPNTVFMTENRKPFYGSGYVPIENFGQIINAITTSWNENRNVLTNDADKLSAIIGNYLQRKEEARTLSPEVLNKAATELASQFDFPSGGMGSGTKFFHPTVLSFLLQQAERNDNAEALEAVENTLQSIAAGGIHDHLEGGFHRYAVDPAWRIPHFEKMLYDQALLSEIFSNAYRITGKSLYAATARKTLDYVLADLTAPKGGFYSTRDADSEGEEGTYYVWTKEQIIEVLGKDEGSRVADIFGIMSTGEFAGKYIINKDSLEGEIDALLEQSIIKLTNARHKRVKPRRDEKILASWNGMMITALANGGTLYGETKYIDAAKNAGNFIWDNMRTEKGRILRSHYAGATVVKGTLNDHGKVAQGFLHLFDATGEKLWLERAQALTAIIISDFEDKEAGDFFASSTSEGFSRNKPRSDSSQPSANATALDVISRLSKRLPKPEIARQAEKAIAVMSGLAANSPSAGAATLKAADSFLRNEQGSVQFAGNGAVRVVAFPLKNSKNISFQLTVAEGWHVNSNIPLEEDYIATNLSIEANGKPIKAVAAYPKATVKTLGFSKKPLALLDETFNITAQFAELEGTVINAKLTIQACSNEICLLPETLKWSIPLFNK